MPCWEKNVVALKVKAEHDTYLVRALQGIASAVAFRRVGQRILIAPASQRDAFLVTIDLDAQTIAYNEADPQSRRLANLTRQAYSRELVSVAAKRHGFTVQSAVGGNRGVLIRRPGQ